MVRGDAWWCVVVRGGAWWSVVVRGGAWWCVLVRVNFGVHISMVCCFDSVVECGVVECMVSEVCGVVNGWCVVACGGVC